MNDSWPGHLTLKARPSLPSLLSSARITGRAHVSVSPTPPPLPSPQLIDAAQGELSDIFTPVVEAQPDPTEDAVAERSTCPAEPQLQLKLQEQLKWTLRRRASASTLETKQSASRTADHLEESIQLQPATRKYYVLTSAGKPVYASDESDPDLMTSSVAVMQAVISIFADENDRIRYINAGTVKISFLLRAPLYLVCVSDFGEPESVLRTHLEYLHLHILSIVSLAQLQRMFAQRSNFDLRRLLEGTDAIAARLISRLQDDFALTTSSLQVLRVRQSVRDDVGRILSFPTKPNSMVYALVLCKGQVVTLLRPRKHSVHPTDLHLLLNTIYATSTLSAPGGENWIPICLPKFNNSGFLYSLVSFLEDGLGIVCLSTDKEAFFQVREWKELQQLRESTALKHLNASAAQYSVGELSIPGLRHFIYKSRSYVQVTSPVWEGPYETERNRIQLMTLYQRVADQLHLKPSVHGLGRQPAKLVYLHTNNECVLGWISSTFEVYIGLAPLLPKSAAVAAAHGVTKWVKAKEAELFLSSAPSFG